MVSSILRTKSVTTKVTESEYGRLEELASASGVNLSEWIRGKLLGADRAGGEAGVVLEEVLALRTILINLVFSLGKGEPMTHEQMQASIDRAGGRSQSKAGAGAGGSGGAGGPGRNKPGRSRNRSGGVIMAEWGRKEYQSWPSRKPVWTLGAFLLTLLVIAGAVAWEYARQWSFAEREYLAGGPGAVGIKHNH